MFHFSSLPSHGNIQGEKSGAPCSFYKLTEKREKDMKKKTALCLYIKISSTIISAHVVVSMDNVMANDVVSHAPLYSFTVKLRNNNYFILWVSAVND